MQNSLTIIYKFKQEMSFFLHNHVAFYSRVNKTLQQKLTNKQKEYTRSENVRGLMNEL